ncbi:MAG: BMP family ABC transporter substrate-binding protein [Oscillospiraceae bacterium]|nr:BMP family ABC transporter substrate-binding protein [Oscillospiraceae bacterium]
MKKIFALLLALCMVLSLCACGGTKEEAKTEEPAAEVEETVEAVEETEEAAMAVAMVTDYGDITDQSFNQTTYEACKAFCEENAIEFKYYKPAGNSTDERVAMIELAIDEGFNTIVMPGFAFAGAIQETVEEYPEITFIALDVSEFDLCFDGDKPLNAEALPTNLYSAVYQEELCGYMAGYAAVKLGYEKLGFLGGMAVPAVVRYGFGFVQGADAAAAELDKTVEMNYAYGNQFNGDADITAVMDTWYEAGTEVVFACGGSIFTSVCEAAQKVDAKVIGVDVDQSFNLDATYGENMTVTSAMKGLAATVKTLLTKVQDGTFEGAKIETLGLVSENPEENYVQIPMTTQFAEGFTAEDYAAMVAAMFNGDIKVSADVATMPETTNTTVNFMGDLK